MAKPRDQVENVRYNLAGADRARERAKQYADLANTLRPSTDRVGATISGGLVRAVRRWISSERNMVASIQLTSDQMDLLHRYFYEWAEAEKRRAEGYEEQAILAAGGTPEPIRPWMTKDQINPRRINVSVSDLIEDPLETIARENT